MSMKQVQEKLAIFDEKLSYQCYRIGQHTVNIKKRYLQILEYSCHGIPWLALATLFTFTTDNNDFWLELLIGLLIDIIYIALAKAFCRRR
ncbi:presqualene diphosphate phosphatase-like protein, partial [Euroglyphus maynei]